jgi:putative sterol carrier protein
MGEATTTFFEELGRRGQDPLLEKTEGTIRFDLARDGKVAHWSVTLHRGAVAVSRRRVRADCVARTEEALFDAFARGDANAMTAVLRGELTFDGDPELLVRFQRLLPATGGRR